MKFLKLLLLMACPVMAQAQSNVFTGNVQLGTQAAVDAFGSQYTVITGKLQVYGPGVKNLNALANIDTVKGKLEILTTDSLVSLDGLDLKYVGNNLYLEANKMLRSITALQSVRFVGKDLVVFDCDSLKSLQGLENIDSIKGSIYIGTQSYTVPVVAKSNDKLENLCALTHVLTTGGLIGTYNVANNFWNPLLADFALGKCANNVFSGNVQLGSQGAIDSFSSQYTKVTGKLQVFGSTPTNLAPLSHIDTVLGKLEILNTDSLVSLAGLHVTYVGSNVYFEQNKELQNINALQTLKYIGKDLVILDCDKLGNLDGLSSLDSIAGHLYIGTEAWKTPPGIKGNDVLIDLCGLKNVITSNGLVGSYNVANNAYNPLVSDYATNNCTQPTGVHNVIAGERAIAYQSGSYFIIETTKKLNLIKLYNTNGQLVYSSVPSATGTPADYRIDHSQLSQGLYILVLEGAHDRQQLKIIK